MITAIATILSAIAIATGTDTQPLEDMPGWDCHTMGNRICGTVTPTGTEPDTGDYVGGYN